MTILKMLALAGGFNRTAKSDHAVIIRRDKQGQQHEMTVDLKKIVERKAEDVRLQSSDILYVPDSTAKRVLVKSIGSGAVAGDRRGAVSRGISLRMIDRQQNRQDTKTVRTGPWR